ncbi:hypothetical protein PVAND_000976 [Polypedilum vanderplanki]|nr:hypothetical protein PVAND_000976 [Polypedilum vanderplanki]
MCKINEISSYLTPNSKENLDWLYFINKGFMNDSQVKSDEEEILIEDWKIFSKALELLENKSPRVVGDVLLLGFLYGYQHLYTMYSFGRIDSFKRGTKKDYQRYEQCLDLLGLYYGPGLLAMYISKYHENSTIVQAENFIREAINDVIIEFSKATDLDMPIKTDVINKLNHTFIVLGGLPQINDMKKMEELYSGIELKGDEKILETTIKLISYHNKIDNEPKSSWKYQVNGLSHLNNLKYIVEQNVLNVPFEYISYPYFHPNRSRFFNTATLFTEVVLTLNEGIKEHLKNNYDINYKLDYDSVELGYKNYLKWEKTNVEKTLPGFNLTNRQLYWLSFANSYFMKYHSNVSLYQLDALNVQFEYFHLWFKFRPEFREAFNCSEPTENEKKEFEVFVKKFYKGYRP